MQALKLIDVNKIYPGDTQAVFDFNIEIEHGEFVVFVGPSGCGKSTVLRMISGLEEISGGDMYLGEERINDVAPADRDVSMVFQNYALYGHMSVYQNMGFSQIIRHEDADVIHEKVMKAADTVQMKQQLNRFPKNLSGGQRQRVALGRSIVGNANIILMDEPLSNLDAKLRGESRRELIKLHNQLGNTFIYVTHDQTEAMTMADRIIVMNDGRIQQAGSPEEVYFWPENIFVGGFIGSPPMNFIQGRKEGSRFVAPGIDILLPDYLHDFEQNNLVLGIRPEHCGVDHAISAAPIYGEIMNIEFLGDRSLLYLKMDQYDFVASVKEHVTQNIGEAAEVNIDIERVHFFDPDTGMRLRSEGAA
jgi:multiple sugar transport system ATP-binding protein